MPRIQLRCQPDFRRDYVLHCLFDIIICIYSSDASTIVFAHARSLADSLESDIGEQESSETVKYQNKMVCRKFCIDFTSEYCLVVAVLICAYFIS